MNIFKYSFFALTLCSAGCVRQSVVTPTSMAPAAVAPADKSIVTPAAAIPKATAPDLVTQTEGRAVAQADAAGEQRPSLIKMGVVEYPEEARLAGIGGEVVLITYIGKDGVPTESVVESQVFVQDDFDKSKNVIAVHAIYSLRRKDGSIVPLANLFDPPAIRAAMQAKFTPGKKAGIAVPSTVRFPVVFRFNK